MIFNKKSINKDDKSKIDSLTGSLFLIIFLLLGTQVITYVYYLYSVPELNLHNTVLPDSEEDQEGKAVDSIYQSIIWETEYDSAELKREKKQIYSPRGSRAPVFSALSEKKLTLIVAGKEDCRQHDLLSLFREEGFRLINVQDGTVVGGAEYLKENILCVVSRRITQGREEEYLVYVKEIREEVRCGKLK